MTTFREVTSGPLIEQVAENLKALETVEPPEWAPYVKTAVHRERPPVQPDWWYLRTASILRKVALHGPIGTQRLAKHYSGPVDRGSKPNRSAKGSRSIIRKALQQLEEAELVAPIELDKVLKGRIVTPAGLSLLDNCAQKVTRDEAA